MPTKRKVHRLAESGDPRPQITIQHREWLAQFASAVVAGGEKSVKRAFDKAEEMLAELIKRSQQ